MHPLAQSYASILMGQALPQASKFQRSLDLSRRVSLRPAAALFRPSFSSALGCERIQSRPLRRLRGCPPAQRLLQTGNEKQFPQNFPWTPQTQEFCRKQRSEEHTSERQSRGHLVCRLL